MTKRKTRIKQMNVMARWEELLKQYDLQMFLFLKGDLSGRSLLIAERELAIIEQRRDILKMAIGGLKSLIGEE